MTAKEYLDQAYRIDARINSKLEQVHALRELAVKASAGYSDMPGCPNRRIDKLEATMAKIIDYEYEINDDIDKLVALRREIGKVINMVPNLDYQTLLEQRYISFKSWEQIAVFMTYNLRWLYKQHKNALDEVQKLIS